MVRKERRQGKDRNKPYDKGGRPTVFTKDVLHKLEDAFMNAFTDKEACLYAGISPSALYEYQELNPKFVERKEQLKLSPNLIAKKELVKAIPGNPDHARWWAQHKIADEFGTKTKVEHSGSIEVDTEMDAPTKAALEAYNKAHEAEVLAEIDNAPDELE